MANNGVKQSYEKVEIDTRTCHGCGGHVDDGDTQCKHCGGTAVEVRGRPMDLSNMRSYDNRQKQRSKTNMQRRNFIKTIMATSAAYAESPHD